MKKRAEEIKGAPLSKKEAARIENEADTVTMPRGMHRAGDTHGHKNCVTLHLRLVGR